MYALYHDDPYPNNHYIMTHISIYVCAYVDMCVLCTVIKLSFIIGGPGQMYLFIIIDIPIGFIYI